jgi:hypothetical protein
MPTSRIQSILDDYQFHNRLILRFVDGISHKESVLQLPFQHNCLNWILGHIVANRSHALEAIGAPHSWQEEVRKLYHTGTPPITEESAALGFPVLVNLLQESLNTLQSGLEELDENNLDESHNNYRGEKTRYEHLTGFHWHETFHIGQLEILRAYIQSHR